MDVQPYLLGPQVPEGGSVGPADEPGVFPNGLLDSAIALQEAVGSPMDLRDTDLVHLYGQDLHSVQTDIGYITAPVVSSGASTGTLRTYERWLRVHFSGSYNTVRQFRFWVTNAASITNGWTLTFGTSTTYHPPVNTASSIAVNAVPIVDPVTPNCGGDHRLIGTGPQYSDWIVLQAAVDLSVVTAPGPALGYDITNVAIPLDFNFAWIEN